MHWQFQHALMAHKVFKPRCVHYSGRALHLLCPLPTPVPSPLGTRREFFEWVNTYLLKSFLSLSLSLPYQMQELEMWILYQNDNVSQCLSRKGVLLDEAEAACSEFQFETDNVAFFIGTVLVHYLSWIRFRLWNPASSVSNRAIPVR